MTSKINENGNTRVVILEGELTIQNILAIKDTLMDAVKHSHDIIIDHSKAEEFDFSYLQLLCSFYSFCHSQEMKASLADGSPETFISLVKESGMDKINPLLKVVLN